MRGTRYSLLMNGLKNAGIVLNRKMLSMIAIEEEDEIRLTLEFRGDRFGEWDAKNMLRLYREIVSRMSQENPWQIGSSEPKLENQSGQSLARDRVLFMDALHLRVQGAPTRIAIRTQDKACTT